MQWLLDVAVIALLAATLFHAMRLERALGVLRRDRAVLEQLVDGFNGSTREAQAGIDRLRAAADGAGRAVARQAEVATALRDDLVFLIERGEKLADRMDHSVRAAGGFALGAVGDRVARPASPPLLPAFAGHAQIERGEHAFELAKAGAAPAAPRLRSQAERDLLAALRAPR